MVNNLAFITGREMVKINPQTLNKSVEVIKASSILPKAKNIVMPKAPSVPQAVYLHGLAGDLAKNDLSAYGVLASDTIRYIPLAIKNYLDRQV